MNFPVSRQAAAVSLALALISSTAIAEVADTVVVTATRTPQLAADLVADTTVINAEEIARSGAGSVADILQRQRGIEIARNGPAGTATSVYVRGANANQIVVLLDGVRIASGTTGTASWNAIPLGAIDRIEIVYGPLSTLYGADAIGGVIQIFTRKGEGAPVVTASLGAGSNATLQGDAGIFGSSGGPNAINYAFGAGYEESDGFSSTRPGASGYNADEDGYRRRNANGRVAMAIMGHRPIPGAEGPSGVAAPATGVYGANPGQDDGWGATGTREKPTGLAIVNLRTREMTIAGQTPSGSGLWHVHGSSDGKWAVGDDFSRSVYLIDRKTREMIMLTTGHKTTAADHPHPTFNKEGTKIQIQSAMLSEDNRSMNIVVVPVPQAWLKR